MQNLLKRHKLAYYEKFKERVLEENEDCIAIQDYFIFLQECFYLDNIILIEEHQDGTKEDFFRSVNSYKRLFKIVELYYIRVKGAGKVEYMDRICGSVGMCIRMCFIGVCMDRVGFIYFKFS